MTKCKVEGCEKEAGVPGSARGLCRPHYRRRQRHGSETAPFGRINYGDQACLEDGCDTRASMKGRCERCYMAARRKADPDAEIATKSRYRQRRRAAQEVSMGRPRARRCELCDGEAQERCNSANVGICFDHDHTTGEPRGWLCDRCNKVLGLVRDNADLLHKMAEYVERGGPPLDFPTFGVPVDLWRGLFREGNA